jgi:preprotein translocase subunit SecY
VALFAGLPKTDRPECTNAVVASIAIHLNDALDDGARQELKALISGFPFGGISILIIVGVALETMKQIDSQLMMRNYDGFLRT